MQYVYDDNTARAHIDGNLLGFFPSYFSSRGAAILLSSAYLSPTTRVFIYTYNTRTYYMHCCSSHCTRSHAYIARGVALWDSRQIEFLRCTRSGVHVCACVLTCTLHTYREKIIMEIQLVDDGWETPPNINCSRKTRPKDLRFAFGSVRVYTCKCVFVYLCEYV